MLWFFGNLERLQLLPIFILALLSAKILAKFGKVRRPLPPFPPPKTRDTALCKINLVEIVIIPLDILSCADF